MKKIHSYNEYFSLVNLKEDLMIMSYDQLSENEKAILSIKDVKSHLTNENFGTKLADAAKTVLRKLVSMANNVFDFIVKVKDFLEKQIRNLLTVGKNKLLTTFKGDKKVVDEVNRLIKLDKNAFISDVKTCGVVSSFYTSKLSNSIVGLAVSSLKKTLGNKSAEVANESVNPEFVEEKIHDLYHYPPFNWLHALHFGSAGVADKAVEFLSHVTQNLGGPAFVLPVISSILGICFEYNFKSLVKHNIIDMVEYFAIPFIGSIIKFIGMVATFLAVFELCREVTATHDKAEKILPHYSKGHQKDAH